jgi:hypothetical protein
MLGQEVIPFTVLGAFIMEELHTLASLLLLVL